jgi:hypothetical protein
MKMRSLIAVGFLALVMVGCSSGEGSVAEKATTADSVAVQQNSAPPVNNAPINLNRDVIRNGSMTVRVPEVEKAEKQLVRDLSALGGYVASSESAGFGGNSPSATLELRVPSARLDAFIEQISGFGVVLNKQLSSEDVTDQLIDIEARMKTLAAQEDKYRGMLSKSAKLSDIYDLENRLGEIRTEIERIAATRKSLKDRAALSELTVTLTQDATTTAVAASSRTGFGEAWGQAGSALLAFLGVAGTIAIWLLVWSPVWGSVAGGAWWLSRRQSRGKVSPS